MTGGGPLLAVDFGTTHSSIGGWCEGQPRIVQDSGQARVPTVTYLPRVGDPIVGNAAVPHTLSDPQATACGIKRLLGRSADEPGATTLRAGSVHRLARGPDGSLLLVLRNEPVSPIQLTAAVLRHLVSRAERAFGLSAPCDAVLTVPPAATPAFREALSRAARAAGLRPRRFVAEPVAALLACAEVLQGGPLVLVCDFGGGTFDTTIARVDAGGIHPLVTDGDDLLGGDDFDLALADGLAGHVFRQHRVELRNDLVSWGQLRVHCESAKRQLTTAVEAHVAFRDAFVAGGRHHDLDVRVDRTWAETRWAPLVERACAVVDRTMARARLTADQLGDVLIVGGTSHIPLFQRALSERLGRRVRGQSASELTVIRGAARLTAPAFTTGPSLCDSQPAA